VAHEVRNPLAGIKGAIQVLISRRRADDGELPVMRDIVSRIDALGELINDLMVFARPRSPRLSAVGLASLLRDAMAIMRRDPVTEGVAIAIEGDEVMANVDADMLRAAILNLMINAAQAMGGRGGIVARVRRADGTAIIDVRDTGPGIPVEIRERVFEPFFTTKSRGGGLGLSIARRTAEIHGGTLAFECPPGGGTVMTMTLPLGGGSAAQPGADPPYVRGGRL
jgi:signal transduction histidine kinase